MKLQPLHKFKVPFLISISILVPILCFSIFTKKNSPDSFRNSQSQNCLQGFSYTELKNNAGSIQRSFTVDGSVLYSAPKNLGVIKCRVLTQAVLKDPRITFFSADKPVSYITADKACFEIPYNSKIFSQKGAKVLFDRSITLSGNVLVTSQDRAVLQADRLTWIPKTNEIYASGNCYAKKGFELKESDTVRTDCFLTDFVFSYENKLEKFIKNIKEY